MFRSYLDHAATSPMPAAVAQTYLEALSAIGNPASTHTDGQLASERLERARFNVANYLGCEAVEVIFTSGGTESINLAIKGGYWSQQKRGMSRPVILVAEGEHHATVEAAEWLRDHEAAEVRWLPIDKNGVLQPETLRRTISEVGAERIALLTFLWANNEVGSLAPVTELCSIARSANIPVHVDAVAALGQVEINVRECGATMVSVSAHKVGGPVGVGALVLTRSAQIEPLFHGGSQQRGRSGTQDVAGAVAFAAALEHIGDPAEHAQTLQSKRDHLISGIQKSVPDAVLRGADPQLDGARLPNNAHFTFPGCQGDSLLFLLDVAGISVSVGSACQAGVQEVSHVLLAMGLPESTAIGSLRMTLSAETSSQEVDALIAALPTAVDRARKAGLS